MRNSSLLALLWVAYSEVREVSVTSSADAFSNATEVMSVQQTMGLDIEASVQTILGFGWLFKIANWYYLVHFPVTLIALGSAYLLSRSNLFVRFRNALIGATGIALLLHVRYPLAPPRMLEGFVDSGAVFGPNPYELAGSDGANQYAAMPSMHVGWAVLVGFLIWAFSTGLVARTLAVLHPLITSFVVVLTANHYVLDVIIGAALAGVMWYIVSGLQRPSMLIPVTDQDTVTDRGAMTRLARDGVTAR